MDEIRQKVIGRLATLEKVKFVKPTAMDLRGPRHLIGRVQRQEDKLYKQRVLKQQKALKLKLAKIDKYRATVRAEEERRLGVLATYENAVEPDYPMPVFQSMDLAVPRPLVRVRRAPIRRRSRVQRRRRLKRLRRVR